ncbi:MAG: UMP kinase [Elusimicrobiota bacterium]
MTMKYKRVLLKMSGESLAGQAGFGINMRSLEQTVSEIGRARKSGTQIAIVIGGGNIWRGAGKEIERVTADYMGMLATIFNALALRDVLETRGIPAKLQSAFEISKIAELYTPKKTIEYLKKGFIVILAGGTGNPYFTTDTTAALRAVEINAEILFKATQVDGIYDSDPKKNSSAKKFKTITYGEAMARNLKIMDITAFSLCKDNSLPIIVFDFYKPGNLTKALAGQKIGTLVTSGK